MDAAAQRLSEFFWEVVLGSTRERVVVFLDGLDQVDDLPFAGDFFTSVRACHDARATEPDYERLSFALVGTAPPREHMLPAERLLFDTGRRVELEDLLVELERLVVVGLAAARIGRVGRCRALVGDRELPGSVAVGQAYADRPWYQAVAV